MDTRTKIIIVIVSLAGAFAIGRFSLPAKVVEKEHIVYQDRIVEKKVYIKDTSKKNNIVIVRTVTIKPDGTKTITTTTQDKSTIDVTNKNTDDKKTSVNEDTTKDKTTTYNTESLIVSGLVKIDPLVRYGVAVDKRVVGPFHLGAFVYTDASFGMSVGIGF